MIHGADALQTRRNSAFVHNHSTSPSFGPRFSSGQKTLVVGPEEAPTRHDQAPEVTLERWLALACTSMPAFGPTLETRLFCQHSFTAEEISSHEEPVSSAIFSEFLFWVNYSLKAWRIFFFFFSWSNVTLPTNEHNVCKPAPWKKHPN